MLTDLSTLLDDGGLHVLTEGAVAVVLVSATWRRDRDGMTPEEDVVRALGTARALADTALDTMCKMQRAGRLKARHGLFEIRCNGVRFYGAHVGRCYRNGGSRDVIVLAGAEQKSGRTKADAALLDRVEAEIGTVRAEVDRQHAAGPALVSVSGHGKRGTHGRGR